jgi:hypothetical protein
MCLNAANGSKKTHSHIVLINDSDNWKKDTIIVDPVLGLQPGTSTPNGLEWTPTLWPDPKLKAAGKVLTIRLRVSKSTTDRKVDPPTSGDLSITVNNGGTGMENQTVTVPNVAFTNDTGAM